MKIKITYLLLIYPALLCAPFFSTLATTTTQEPVLEEQDKPLPVEKIASKVADRLPHTHLSRADFDDNISTNAVMLYVDSLDYDHSFFLQSDIDEFEQQATHLADQVKKGDISFANKVFDRFKERVNNRTEYTYELLDKGFDLEKNESYCWKRDEEPWPADKEGWDELWRKKIKNEYVSRVAALEADPEEDKNKKNSDKPNTEDDLEEEESLSPKEFVRDRHEQYKTLIETNFDEETIVERYLDSFAKSYDPHTDYLSPRSVEDFDIQMSLSFVGIGATLSSDDGAAEIQSLIAGGPAEEDGRLKAGDKIIAVAQGDEKSVSIMHWPISKAVRLIRGKKGTKVVLTIIPAEDRTGTKTKKIDLIRDEIKLEESAAKSKIFEIERNGETKKIGQIILPDFYADYESAKKGNKDARRSSTDILKILREFAKDNVDGVIIDLRNDGGGSLIEAIDITGFFIPIGPVVQVKERRGTVTIPDSDPETQYKGPLVVLVNRLSASASEILAAALQDYGRAIIVGDKTTHGKGTVQTVLPLSRFTDSLGSLKVTTASFHRINGGSTQLRGVTPDIVLPSLFASLDIGEESLPNALPWTPVNKAWYRMWNPSIKPMIGELAERSKKRTNDNEEFQNYLAKLDLYKKRMDAREISLNLEDRIEDIHTEEVFDDLYESQVPNKDDNEDDGDKKDLVLDETLEIVADMIELTPTPSSATTYSSNN